METGKNCFILSVRLSLALVIANVWSGGPSSLSPSTDFRAFPEKKNAWLLIIVLIKQWFSQWTNQQKCREQYPAWYPADSHRAASRDHSLREWIKWRKMHEKRNIKLENSLKGQKKLSFSPATCDNSQSILLIKYLFIHFNLKVRSKAV